MKRALCTTLAAVGLLAVTAASCLPEPNPHPSASATITLEPTQCTKIGSAYRTFSALYPPITSGDSVENFDEPSLKIHVDGSGTFKTVVSAYADQPSKNLATSATEHHDALTLARIEHVMLGRPTAATSGHAYNTFVSVRETYRVFARDSCGAGSGDG